MRKERQKKEEEKKKNKTTTRYVNDLPSKNSNNSQEIFHVLSNSIGIQFKRVVYVLLQSG